MEIIQPILGIKGLYNLGFIAGSEPPGDPGACNCSCDCAGTVCGGSSKRRDQRGPGLQGSKKACKKDNINKDDAALMLPDLESITVS